jgi:hypothetical protein
MMRFVKGSGNYKFFSDQVNQCFLFIFIYKKIQFLLQNSINLFYKSLRKPY